MELRAKDVEGRVKAVEKRAEVRASEITKQMKSTEKAVAEVRGAEERAEAKFRLSAQFRRFQELVIGFECMG